MGIKSIGQLLACILAVGVLAGCASQSRIVEYGANDGSQMDIQVSRTQGPYHDSIKLMVNSEEVATGSVNVMKTSDVLSAEVDAKTVEAQCYVTEGAMSTGLSCELYVDGEDAGVTRL